MPGRRGLPGGRERRRAPGRRVVRLARMPPPRSPLPARAPARRTIEAAILAVLRERGRDKTACPSEVARALDADHWRPLMAPVREAAARLVDRGMIEALQRGRVVDIATARGAIRLRLAAAVRYAEDYRGVDFRKHPERYRVGKGEQGVLVAEPYRSELVPLWRFKTPAIARASAKAIWEKFVAYRDAGEGPGMDMARKYLQMGFTRARRYANHAGGRKYDEAGKVRPRGNDPGKAEAAEIFRRVWQRAERDARLSRLARGAARSHFGFSMIGEALSEPFSTRSEHAVSALATRSVSIRSSSRCCSRSSLVMQRCLRAAHGAAVRPGCHLSSGRVHVASPR